MLLLLHSLYVLKRKLHSKSKLQQNDGIYPPDKDGVLSAVSEVDNVTMTSKVGDFQL